MTTTTTTTKRTDPHRPGAIVPADYTPVLAYAKTTVWQHEYIPSHGIDCTRECPWGLESRLEPEQEAAALATARALKAQAEAGDREAAAVLGDWAEEQGIPRHLFESANEDRTHALDGRCCIVGLREVARVEWAATGHTGKCSVCGAVYSYGQVWRHDPTGEHVHVGHDCADKYGLMMDTSKMELALGRRREAAAKVVARRLAAEERAKFLAENPGLETALETVHPVVQDIAGRFAARRFLSPRQVELVLRIAREAAQPRVEEKRCFAPTSRRTFVGTVVSVKTQQSDYGTTLRVTVRVEEPDGSTWLAWGTCPRSILDAANAELTRRGVYHNEGGRESLRGRAVRLTATLKPGREPHFALMSRPVGALVSEGEAVRS